VAPEQVHLEFNVAFLQNQIAQLVYGLPETKRTVADVEAAATGLGAAIEAFERIAQAKTPPYPRSALEQRASMGRNTISKQLERALASQREYEAKNAAKLQQAREQRDAERRRREEVERQVHDAEVERKRKMAEERQLLIEETQRLAEMRAEEERAREEAELTTDSETGDRVKRKKKPSKRKKKDDDAWNGGEDAAPAGESAVASTRAARWWWIPTPRRKRRRMESNCRAMWRMMRCKTSRRSMRMASTMTTRTTMKAWHVLDGRICAVASRMTKKKRRRRRRTDVGLPHPQQQRKTATMGCLESGTTMAPSGRMASMAIPRMNEVMERRSFLLLVI
jgi:RNA polymerase-associated protein CTR9